MAKLQIDTLASFMRDLRSKVNIIPFDTEVPEEATNLPPQINVNPEKWGVSPVETWSKSRRQKISMQTVWDSMIYYLDEGPKDLTVEFNYFMDGIQRTTPVGKIHLRKSSFESLPIHYAQIGAVLLKREHRTLSNAHEEILNIIEFPNSFVKSATNREELKEGILDLLIKSVRSINTVDTSYRIASLKDSEKEDYDDIIELDGIKYPRLSDDELWTWCTDPSRFRSQARRWTTRYRDIIEQKLYDKALELYGTLPDETKHEFVIKDGPLTHVRGEIRKSALGVIKSFSTNFLKLSQMTKVLSLPYGYRSPVFTKTRPEGDPENDIFDPDSEAKKHTLLSWYLRIRPIINQDPTWGLLRIEIHVEALPSKGRSGRWQEQDSLIIDEISRQLCKEALPTSHPDARWHNLLYPIKCCEKFLQSRTVPHMTARYLFGGG